MKSNPKTLHTDPIFSLDPTELVCTACQNGPFSYQGFRSAIRKEGQPYPPDAMARLKAKYGGSKIKEKVEPIPRPNFQYTYSRKWSEIVQSAHEEKCSWCLLLIRCRDNLPDENYLAHHADKEVAIRLQVILHPPNESWMPATNGFEVHLDDFKAGVYWIWAEPGNTAALEIGTGDHFKRNPSYVDYERTKQCLDTCVSGMHSNCSTFTEPTLPTRVIDCSNPKQPRLFITNREIKGRYCTLSYVWGGEQKRKTTTSSLNAYITEGISVEDLPQTLADAILVTHNLGIQYLWIDALCILQDSEEDKTYELSNMTDIFQRAYVSLVAFAAFRADQGFLPDTREPSITLPYYVEKDDTQTDQSITPLGWMHIKQYIERQNTLLGYRHQSVRIHDPLNTRAWCYQETILSPRRLFFSPPNLRYECRTYFQDITRLEEGGTDITLDNPFPGPGNINRATYKPDHRDPLHRQWVDLITTYTQCRTTLARDKLVAFSSVTQIFEAKMKDQYLAGLWRKHLIDGLLWTPFGQADNFPRPSIYRAPTWSWASIDGPTMIHQQHMLERDATEYEAEVISSSVTPKSMIHPLGEIIDGHLTLKAKMHSLMPDAQPSRLIEHKGVPIATLFFSSPASRVWFFPKGNCLEWNGRTPTEIRLDCKDGSEDDADFHIVILRAGRKWGDQDISGWMMALLVVKDPESPEENIYKRVASVDLKYLPGWFETAPMKTIILI